MAEAGIRWRGRQGATPLLLLSLVATGSGLRCYQCVGMFGECIHTEQLCAPRDRSCFSSSIKLFYPTNGTGGVFMLPDLEIAEYVMKGCSAEGVSNWTAELSSEDDREVHTTFRCDRDLCNARIPGAAFASTAQPAPNGMECYSCFDRGTGDCAPGNATRTRCLGDMDQCMDFTVTDGPWKMTYRACALETLCRRQYLLPQLSGRLEIRCCSVPLCNDGRPGSLLKGSLCRHFAQQGTEREPENGLSCTSCCDSGQGECGPGNGTVVRCRGEQRVCVNVTEGGRTLLRGCSLEKLCRETPRLLGLGREASTSCCSVSFCNGAIGKAGGWSLPAVLLLPAALASASAFASSVLAQR